MKHILLAITATIIFTGCASIFLPRKQKVLIKAPTAESKIYVDNTLVATGDQVKVKIEKKGAQDVTIQTPGLKDSKHVLLPNRRSLGYQLLQIPNPLWGVLLGFFWDGSICVKCMSYGTEQNFTESYKLPKKNEADKYIYITNISIDLKNKDNDWRYISTYYSNPLLDKLNEKELRYDNDIVKEEARAAKKKKKETLNEEKSFSLNDTRFTENVYNTLRKSGYMDTVNTFFTDFNNSVFLEGKITRLTHFEVYGKKEHNSFIKCKLYMTWYLKNKYLEIMDSIKTVNYSGEFTFKSDQSYIRKADEVKKLVYPDAVDIAFLQLQETEKFKALLKKESNYSLNEPVLSLKSPKNLIADKADVSSASVIVKTPLGHGSGFAVTEDGYLITNYHVISNKKKGPYDDIKIILGNGEEVKAKVVRANKVRDIALLKVEKTFEKVFKVSSTKSFKNLQDVFTMGAPKSIELGQTISMGIISNERNTNNNNLLQLNMAVNSGNSGGPLFDGGGNLHGVIVSKAVGSNTEGISFAIPGYKIEEYLNINFK
jgi:S1-C subfamily serine protease